MMQKISEAYKVWLIKLRHKTSIPTNKYRTDKGKSLRAHLRESGGWIPY